MQNADLQSISEMLGHPTTRMTERYAHAAPGHLLAGVQRLSRPSRSSATDTAEERSA